MQAITFMLTVFSLEVHVPQVAYFTASVDSYVDPSSARVCITYRLK